MAARRRQAAQGRERVCVGIISGARGLKGDVRVTSFTAAPEDVGAYGPVEDESGERRFVLKVTGRARDQVIVRIDGVTEREAIERLKGTRLYVGRDALPEPDEDEFYYADLIGLRAERQGGGADADLGRVKAVHDFGGGAVIEIEGPAGGTVMLPFTRAAVPLVDVAGGRLEVAQLDWVDAGAATKEDETEGGQ